VLTPLPDVTMDLEDYVSGIDIKGAGIEKNI
jgi:hypothetical protein